MARIIVLKPAHFFSIDNDIIDVHAKTIGAIGVAVYAVLARYANRKTGECWPSIGKIGKLLDLARNTVKDALRKLEDVGLIMMQRLRRAPEGHPTSHLYTLLDATPQATEARQREMAAESAAAKGRSAGDLPLLEAGRSAGDLPLSGDDLPGRSPADPEPKVSPEHKELNQALVADATEETPQPQPATPCPHPEEESYTFGDIFFCLHCKTTYRIPVPIDGTLVMAEEDQAHAATLAGVAD
jgi:hypothetical protein